jgi:SAM-dependent methyltransferase
MSFDDLLVSRSADVYADFLVRHLSGDELLLDVGCGQGSITVGLASNVGHVVGVDLEDAEFADARNHVRTEAIGNVDFREGSAYELNFPDRHFDACLAHSTVETLERPVEALHEIHRTLKPGAVVGVASVEYGGLILGGPQEPALHRFYELRTRLWRAEGVADPFRGRALRGLLHSAGFVSVDATTTAISYGTPEAVRAFGRDRAQDCRDEWYVTGAERVGIGTEEDVRDMERAWLTWSESPEAYASFSWCRAVGFRPGP